MPLLISGPPGSSTTQSALDRYHARAGSLLLVPTATMADHLRHSLVRSGVSARPKSVQTLAAFLDQWSPLAAAPVALVQLCMERALARIRPARFEPVAEFPGVVRALAGLFGEISGKRMPEDVGRLFADVERQLAAKRMAPRHARLAAAATRISSTNEPLPPHIVFDGFFKLSVGESSLLAALSHRTEVTITLPEWSGAQRAREGLLGEGFDEVHVQAAPSDAIATLFTAATMEREIEEIAARIVQEIGKGRLFREIGIVLRTRDPYGPLVETTLARFGIPARAYFSDVLASHPAIQYRMTLIRSALAGWDHAVLLTALRMPASGLGATKSGDARDFEMRKQLPARGWPDTLLTLGRLDPSEWASRLKHTRDWSPELAVEDRAEPDRVQAWRSTSVALAAFDDALDSTALALEGEGRMPLATFWKQVESVLSQEQLRVPDARRNVVHILDAYEARQWSLPLVFVPGLTERHFPQYHREDAIVGDAALRRAGLDTAADREKEEHFLFELATTRATEETVLSYPRFDESGQQTLPSFFLPPTSPGEPIASASGHVRPTPTRTITLTPHTPISDASFAARKLSAGSVDSYVQCPFQFLVRKALRAVERPKAPRDRLDFLLQGNIIHKAFSEWSDKPLLGTALLEQAFDELCEEAKVTRTYRTEAIRLEMLRNFDRFLNDRQVSLGWSSQVEEPFEFELQPGVVLHGRLDRMDLSPDGRALVIDYKYSPVEKQRSLLQDSESGHKVQAGVYMLAAERFFGHRVAGMLYCHLKKDVGWGGWHANIPGLEVGAKMTEDAVRSIARTTEETVLRVHAEIATGGVAVAPRDPKLCVWCESRDICRVESIERVKTATSQGEAQ